MEIDANRIAARLLMPEEQFRKIWKESNSVEAVATKFEVSVGAATIRASNLLTQTTL